MTNKPTLSFAQIFNMSFGFFGIQFGFALQNANASRIFETLGAEVDQIPILWIAAPLTGLIVQPIIGYFSDRTWTRFGRRRPYFFIGAILTTLALFIFPNSPVLWFAAIGLWLLDISINITMEPFRAFVGDNLPHSQRTLGYAMQSLLIGVGAVIASLLPYVLTKMGVANTTVDGSIPDSVRYSFYCGGLVLLFAVLWTVYSSKEYSTQQLSDFSESQQDDESLAKSTHPFLLYGLVGIVIGLGLTAWVYVYQLKQELYVAGLGLLALGVMFCLTHLLQAANRRQSGFYEMMDALFMMPATMKRLAFTQFFSWFGLFAMWIYTTSTVASHHYQAGEDSGLYNEAANHVGVLFASYNGVAAVVALLIPFLSRYLGRKLVYALFLLGGGLGLLSYDWISDPSWLFLSMIGVGLAWAAILSIPYAILSSALPYRKMGLYMGVFNFFIVLPQLLAASILGYLVQTFFDSLTIYAIMLGGASMLLAALTLYFVPDPQGEKGLIFSKAS